MDFKVYDYLPESAKFVRQTVFVEEQGFVNELDETDNIATHIVLYDEKTPAATCRIFQGEKSGEYILGRLAVMKDYRGKNIGSMMLAEAEKCASDKGGNILMLHSQCRAKDFYAKSGYTEFGEIGYDEGCPHIWMKKQLG